MNPALPLYKVSAQLSATGAIKAAPGRLIAVLVTAAAAAASWAIENSTAGSGTTLTTVSAPIGGSVFVDLSPLGGMEFTTGIYATLAGEGGLANFWFE
jgi:hypothetical protein